MIWLLNSLCSGYLVDPPILRFFPEIIGLILIIGLYVAALKLHPGTMLFFGFILVNVGYLLTVASKFLEGILFPSMVLDRYRWSASVCLLLVSPLILIPVYYFLRWEKKNISLDNQPTYIWQYSWLVPATFYLIWAHDFYGSGDPVRWSMQFNNVVFLTIVNLAGFLIYYLILRMFKENSEYLRLREENHALSLQLMQYDGLNQRIALARQGRHDLRHHILTMDSLVKQGNIAELRNYLNEMGEKYKVEGPLSYCSNTTVNAVLSYFYDLASSKDIEFNVKIGIPEDIHVDKTDLSILFGNLLENSMEACQRQASGPRKISVRGQTSQNTFTLVIENTYETFPEKDHLGRFRSMKHSGLGIGTESVKNIVARYNGVVQFETRGDLFGVSLMLYLQ